jgi:hypothetical protein
LDLVLVFVFVFVLEWFLELVMDLQLVLLLLLFLLLLLWLLVNEKTILVQILTSPQATKCFSLTHPKSQSRAYPN